MISFEDIRPQLKRFVQEGCETADYIMRVSKTPKDGIYAYEELGEIVRCRDCVHYADHEWITSPQYGLGTDIEHVCHFWHGKPTKVEPDGFCAWGKERTPNG